MKLYAISDLHLNYPANLEALKMLPPHPEDWLILGGDIGDGEKELSFAFSICTKRFQKVFWVPGNHELWTMPDDKNGPRGVARYESLIAICRDFGVHTPEDPFIAWPGPGGRHLICPLFILYDYSFRPPEISYDQALEWAAEAGIVCTDEMLLSPEPYATKAEWCRQRCELTEKRLESVTAEGPLVLINHYPLREDLVHLHMIPRFSLWCGTHYTEDWHVRFPAAVVVSGHLHMRATEYRDGIRFEEVSLGYPRHWTQSRGMEFYLREILPGPAKNPI